jgi:hypothetical protein
MGEAYKDLLRDRQKLLMQMQAHAACDDPEIREAVRRNFGDLVAFFERVSGGNPTVVTNFLSHGMLLNVIAAMGLLGDEEGWAKRLLDGLETSKG